ncbi:MAG: hypothetical protein Q8L47_04415 [bacterium]|nr:hypothetical protein [bacterium]
MIPSKLILKKHNSKFMLHASSRGGQLMLTTVLILGGTMIGASLIAGFLTLRSIRQGGLAVDSAQAIFAADAGLDFMFNKCFKLSGCTNASGFGSVSTCDNNGADALKNGACYVASYKKDMTDPAEPFIELRSIGYSNWSTKAVARTLLANFM